LEQASERFSFSQVSFVDARKDIRNIRSMRNDGNGMSVQSISQSISSEDRKILAREIISKKGEILFARALILAEGITEEQVIPAICDLYTNKSLFALGILCVGVSGKNYPPFVKLACSLGIPTYIISDNDGSTKTEIESQLKKIRDEGYKIDSDILAVSYLGKGNNFEAELLNQLPLKDEIIEALVLSATNATDNPQYRAAKLKEISALSDADLLKMMRENKTSYSGFLADVIRENPNKKDPAKITPIAVTEALQQLTKWLKL
jgi:putative ATP-dependent endonuclease of OLD family